MVAHDEYSSQIRNPFEQVLIAQMLKTLVDPAGHGLDPAEGHGVMVPHRAQGAALQQAFPELRVVDSGIYVVTCERQYWMLFDTKHPEKGYRALGPILRDQPNTLIDKRGRATAITKDYQVARYDPAADKVTVDPLVVDGKPFRGVVGPKAVHPGWWPTGGRRTCNSLTTCGCSR